MIWTLPPLPAGATLSSELFAAAVTGALFLLVLAIAAIWRRVASPPVEWTRKFAHISSGIVAAFFPWWFRSHWTLLALGAVLIGLFALGERRGWFASVTGVERHSAGERWFPVGVYALFVIARERPVFYLIALSSLVVSDSLAALLGARYGRHTYAVSGDRKSLEGSAAFMLATFAGVVLPLMALTTLGRGECAVIALQLSILATAFEAISQRGNDNLIVPLATYYLLVKMTPHGWEQTAIQLVAQLALFGGCLLIAWRTRFLSFAGAIAAHLVLYGTFSLGNPGWTLSPALALGGYLLIDALRLGGSTRPAGGHQVQGVFYVSIVAVALLGFDNTFATLITPVPALPANHPFLAPFIGALAAPLAITVALELRLRRIVAGGRGVHWILGGVLGLAGVAPLGLLAAGAPAFAEAIVACAALVALSLALYARLLARRPAAQDAVMDLRSRALSVAAAAFIVTPLHLAWMAAAA